MAQKRNIDIKGKTKFTFKKEGDKLIIQTGLTEERVYWANPANFLVGCVNSSDRVCGPVDHKQQMLNRDGVTAWVIQADCFHYQPIPLYLSAKDFGYNTGEELLAFIESVVNPVVPPPVVEDEIIKSLTPPTDQTKLWLNQNDNIIYQFLGAVGEWVSTVADVVRFTGDVTTNPGFFLGQGNQPTSATFGAPIGTRHLFVGFTFNDDSAFVGSKQYSFYTSAGVLVTQLLPNPALTSGSVTLVTPAVIPANDFLSVQLVSFDPLAFPRIGAIVHKMIQP